MVQMDILIIALPLEQSCADRVVRKLEAEILGCCGRACGWNNRSCMAWPFFTQGEKVSWLEECCTELYPIGSMYAIYVNIYHQYTPNVSIYTIHGSYGY